MVAANEGVILIVDDTPTNLDVLFDLLESYGFKVLVAEDGESAIQRAEYGRPDLILLDIIMPQMDGFETCKALKVNQITKDIPVIFMTALTETVYKVKGLTFGAVDYITKPLQHEEVLARIKLHLSLRNLTKTLQEKNIRLEKEIFERQRSEEKIREQAVLLDIATDAILVQDLENGILFWNKGAERLYGWKAEEAIGKNANELLYQGSVPPIQSDRKSLFERGSWQGELRQVTREGKGIIVETRWTLVRNEDGQPKSILIVNTDITEKKQLEVQFLRSQRMESIGTLASGIAHNINNSLAPIMMSIQLLAPKLQDEQSQRLLKILEINSKRSADLIKQVLSFARGVEEGNHTILQVERLILEIEQMSKQTFPRSIEILTDLPTPQLWPISGDVTQLHQVLMNLCVNARDAMPNGGVLEISAKNTSIDESHARMNLNAKVGSYVEIAVSDTGIGIPQEIADRIFEPFFTTKELGKGTGLGLPTVMAIIKSHGGFLEVFSEVRKGTQFKVYLPATQNSLSDDITKEDEELPKGQGELILVVDDEDLILEVAKASLEIHNYKVITATDGIDGVAQYVQYKNEIDVVLVDMMMPTMDGMTTIRTLQKINPLVKIIAVSGLSSAHQVSEAFSSGIKTFLPKPYTSQELLLSLRAVLRESDRPPVLD